MELQYLKCLWASCYKIGMKYYQQEQTDLSLEALSLAYHMKTLNNSLESIDNILQHLKEVIIQFQEFFNWAYLTIYVCQTISAIVSET